MESNPLLPLPKGMQIDQIQASENEVSITVIATPPVVAAVSSLSSACANSSAAIRSVRKKSRRERLPDLVRPWAQMTIRY